MARGPQKTKTNKTKAAPSSPKKGQLQHGAPQRRRSPEEAQQTDALLDDKTRRDIVGVLFIVAGVVLLLLAAMPQNDALVSNVVSQALHLTLGVGCFVLPVVLCVVGITFLVKFKKERVPLRATIGLSVIFIALLGFIALFAPIATLGVDDPDMLFAERTLESYGGYVGSGIAWCGIMLFGRVVTGVILVGIMLVGLIIIGFSVSQLIERLNAKRREFESHRHDDPYGPSGSAGFARIRKGSPGMGVPQPSLMNGPVDPAWVHPGFDPNKTAALDEGYGLVQPVSVRGAGKGRLEVAPLEASQMTRPLRPLPSVAPEPEAPDASPAETHDEVAPVAVAPKAPASERRGSPREAAKAAKEAKRAAAQKRASADTAKPVKECIVPTPQEGYELPDLSLLEAPAPRKKSASSSKALSAVAAHLQQVIGEFGIEAEVVDWIAGPTVTLFEVNLPAGVRVSRITALSDDIALALASPGVRIFAPVPGTNYVGIEVPNAERETVLLTDVLKDAPAGPLQIAIGKDVEGNSIVSDLAKMPHLLIGGTTGSGKSVAINAMIMSILMRATPSEVRFIMIDPKRVEFTPYNGIPHLYVPVVTEPKEAASALSWGVAEMERRLKIFSGVGARNIAQYNAKAQAEKANADKDGEDENDASQKAAPLEEMPYIVIIIDELADLMMNIGKEVELSISRIAQLARAAGIHLIVATQRPSTNVVTGLIKANITNRIAFNVASGIDSRVVLDSPGAESLIGLGDLLLSKPELAKPQRIQGCFVTEDEINRVVEFVKGQCEPEYHADILQTNVYTIGATDPAGGGTSGDHDPLLWEAADIVVSSGMGSTSNIQRRLKVGYARAGRIMDQLEEAGIVGPANGSRPREVLVDEMELETVKAFETASASNERI